MAAEKKISTITTESLDNSQELIQNSWEYYKLKLFYHTSEISISFIKYCMLGIFAIMAAVFLSIGLSIYIGEGVNSSSLGYAIVGGIYILLGMALVPFRGIIEKAIVKKLSKTLLRDE